MKLSIIDCVDIFNLFCVPSCDRVLLDNVLLSAVHGGAAVHGGSASSRPRPMLLRARAASSIYFDLVGWWTDSR